MTRLFFTKPHAACLKLLLLTVACLSLSTVVVRAQNEQVAFSARTLTVAQAFIEIERQTEYLISFDHTDFDVTRKVRLKRGSLPLRQALDQLLSGSGRGFLVRGNHILIIPVEEVGEAEPAVVEPPAPPTALHTDPGPDFDPKRPPVDLDSLERALRARADLHTSAEAPAAPKLDETAYDNYRQTNGLRASGRPRYTGSMPFIALRTNLLYWASTTPNLGVEIGISPHSTFLLTGSINPWKAKNPETTNKMLKHWLASLEYRYWFCERFNGHFLGVHGYGGHFNISGHKIPLMFKEKNADEYRYKGDVYGAGISYGYQFMLGRHWNLELNAGVGFGHMKYERRNCPRCNYDDILPKQSRTFFAPTKLGISIVYIIK